MKLTSIELEVYSALFLKGPSGIGTLQTKCPNLASKVQLKNILNDLTARDVIKLQSNSQFAIPKALHTANVEDNIVPEDLKKPEPKSIKKPPLLPEKQSKDLVDDIPKFTGKTAEDQPEVTSVVTEQTEDKSTEQILLDLMKVLPDKTEITLDRDGITVSWKERLFEASSEELGSIFDAINVLEQFEVAA